MGVNLDVLVGYSVPIEEPELLRLPERLSGRSFERWLKACSRPLTIRESAPPRSEPSSARGTGRTLARVDGSGAAEAGRDEVRRRGKMGLAPTMHWAGFHVDFCLVGTRG